MQLIGSIFSLEREPVEVFIKDLPESSLMWMLLQVLDLLIHVDQPAAPELPLLIVQNGVQAELAGDAEGNREVTLWITVKGEDVRVHLELYFDPTMGWIIKDFTVE